MDELRQRLTDLEIRYSHQSLTIEELNQVLIAQERRLAALERENAGFRELLKTLGPSLVESPDE